MTAALAVALLRPDAWARTSLPPVSAPPTTVTVNPGPSTTTTIPGDGSPTPVDAGPSTDADPTWGTGMMADSTAQRVLAMTVVGRRVYLAGEFTVMTPPGAKAITPPTTTTTTTTSTTTTTTSGSTPVQPRAMTVTPPSSPPTTEPPSRNWLAPPVRTEPPGVARQHLAALDVDRHTLLPWDPDADGTVEALAVSADGTQLYVGGDFDHIGGKPASKLARIDLATGKLDPAFHPGVRGSVRALALAGDRLYVGGTFSTVAGPNGGESRPKLAALAAATGDLLPWMPPALGPGRFVSHAGSPMPTDSPGDVLALAVPPVDGLIYVGGTFLDLGGQSAVAVLDPVTGQIVPEQWGIRRPIYDLAVSPADGQTVFASAGGSGGQVYAFRSTAPKRPVWDTWVDGDAPGVAASDTHVYLMGHYDYAGPDNQLRHHLAAFNADNGAVDGWNPTANTPYGAFAAAVGADHVFVGGAFTRINGHLQPGFAQFAVPPAP
ncbi:MAG TPA: delta-60 repeat domain-containing protein [Acidimicrobiia bacterium]|nr:delta-60 repeat domain-containing protein [Acidimicrobiia bacterium]